ncbi:MAG: hypothetical protein FJY88_04450 [Candidatus Eisenbacteria bacterium]|nr:hypothetical protein [Candidatus Eisenbacteria bacterium]
MASHRVLIGFLTLASLLAIVACDEDKETPNQPIPQSTVRFTAAAFDGSEGLRSVSVHLRCDAAVAAAVSVRCATSDSSATAGEDYTGIDRSVAFAAGDTAQTVSIDVIGDGVVEGDETFIVSLSAESGPVKIGYPGRAVVRLQDDDSK